MFFYVPLENVEKAGKNGNKAGKNNTLHMISSGLDAVPTVAVTPSNVVKRAAVLAVWPWGCNFVANTLCVFVVRVYRQVSAHR